MLCPFVVLTMAPPRRSRRKHTALDDSSTISSGVSSAGGLTYTTPSNYRTKSQKPDQVHKAKTNQLSKLPLPPPRSARWRSTRSMTSTGNATHATGMTYTSNVSKVSIRSREPVLESNDPLARAMQEKISQSAPPANEPPVKKSSPPEIVSKSAPSDTELHVEKPPPPEIVSKNAPSGDGDAPPTIVEAIPTQGSSIEPTGDDPVVLPPPPQLNPFETNSLSSEDPCKKPGRDSRKRRLLVCLAAIILLFVVGAIVVSVVLVLGNKDSGGGEMSPQVPTPAPSLRPPTAHQVPSQAPVFIPPILPPIGTDTVPNLERLIDFFAEKDPNTALILPDPASPQYRAMEWLALDVEQNSFTLQDNEARIMQRGVLAIFYYSTLGDVQWTDQTGWLDSILSECDWFGTQCLNGEMTLVSLGLQGNELGGSIPHELFLMGTLEGVTLSENAIGGTIPTSIGQLSLLSTLLVVFLCVCMRHNMLFAGVLCFRAFGVD